MRKMGVASLVREELDKFQELEDEKSAATIRCAGNVTATATRLSFFQEYPAGGDWHKLNEAGLLGYAVIVTLTLPDEPPRTFVLEAVIRVPMIRLPSGDNLILSNHYVHCARDFETTVGTAGDRCNYKLPGTFFCQQNALTHVCAHAALRTAINSSPLYTGKKLENSMINKVVGIDHSKDHRVGKYKTDVGKTDQGLSPQQIQTAVKSLGFGAHVWDFEGSPVVDYAEYLYPLIESGCPVILGVRRPRVAHVLAVLGHTVNSDRWTPDARAGYGGLPNSRFISASAWADHFIIADDNFGMYVTLPTDSVRNFTVPKYNHELHAAVAIGIVPAGVSLPGFFADQLACLVATRLIEGTIPAANRWFQLLKDHLGKPGEHLVSRSILQHRDAYVGALMAAEDGKGAKLGVQEEGILRKELPDRFWVTEITLPNLLTGNKRKLGDIVARADATEKDLQTRDAQVFAWLPGAAWTGAKLSNPPLAWPIQGHIEILRGTGPTRPKLEW